MNTRPAPGATYREQFDEMLQSKDTLAGILGSSVTSFAYPYGSVSGETVELARAAGYDRACSTATRGVNRRADCLCLPRFQVNDWDGEDFSKRLKFWLAGRPDIRERFYL